MDKRINRFIKCQTVATVSCVAGDNKPYGFGCFYAFDKTKMQLYVDSAAGTHHIKLLKIGRLSVAPTCPINNQGCTPGIQFSGLPISKVECAATKAACHLYYPLAFAMNGDVYTLEP